MDQDSNKADKSLGIQRDEMKPTSELSADAPQESIAFSAGRKARAMKIPLRQSALRVIRPGCKQYDDFIDGYEYEAAQRKRKPKTQQTSEVKG